MNELIYCEQVFHNYPTGVQALKGVSLKIYKNEFVALIGQNGSGKTTLAKHFNGLLRPTSGKVIVMGQDTRHTPTNILSKYVGYVFQNPDHMLFSSTIWEEVAFGPRNLGLSENEINERVKKALKICGLEGLEEQSPFLLGKGQRRLITLAAILSMEPEILVIDEPTTGMDYNGYKSVMNVLKELNKNGHTLIVITHDMHLVAEYAKRVLVMSNGKIIADGDVKQVFLNKEALQTAYLKPPQVFRISQKLGLIDPPLTVDEMISNIKSTVTKIL